MKLPELSRLAHDAGLALVQRSEHHYQLTDPQGAALVDVWPSTNRFRRHKAQEGKKATQGNELSAIQCAKQALPKPLPPVEAPINPHPPGGLRVSMATDPLQPLIDLFREEEWQAGRDGDHNGMTTAETAARLIRQLRAKVQELSPREKAPYRLCWATVAGKRQIVMWSGYGGGGFYDSSDFRRCDSCPPTDIVWITPEHVDELLDTKTEPVRNK